MKRIAIMTSGGDAPGMNACIYSIYQIALKKGYEVFCIKDAFKGLVENNIFQLNKTKEDKLYLKQLSIQGGTFLGSVRFKEFEQEEYQRKAINNLKELNINNLIVLGGNGSFKGAFELSKYGINVQGIPVTIDNDLFYTQYSIGFMSAVNTVIDCSNKIKDTMNSHHRMALVETMGNKCGELPLFAGVIGHFDCIYIPEIYSSYSTLVTTLNNKISNKEEIRIVLVSEAICHVEELKDKLEKDIKKEIRCVNLGHIQRGGNPCEFDINIAKCFAKQAMFNIECGIYNKAIGIEDGEILSLPLDEVDTYKSHNGNSTYEHFIKLAKEINGVK